MRASEHRTVGQYWADKVTEFSGSWAFIGWFTVVCVIWIVANATGATHFDVYPFLFLNWVLTIVSTFQNPLILLSQTRQNERDRESMARLHARLDEISAKLEAIKAS